MVHTGPFKLPLRCALKNVPFFLSLTKQESNKVVRREMALKLTVQELVSHYKHNINQDIFFLIKQSPYCMETKNDSFQPQERSKESEQEIVPRGLAFSRPY